MRNNNTLQADADFSVDPDFDRENTPQAQGKFLLGELGDWMYDAQAQEAPTKTESPVAQEKQFDSNTLKSEGVQQRVLKVAAAENPLLEAAQPLLCALSEMPSQIKDINHVGTLKNTLKSEINLFGIVCEEVNIPWKKMAVVRYCICTALDERAHTTSWGLESGWAQSNLLNHFEGDNDGGNKFFLLIGRLSMNPNEFADVLEVLLRILGLGFEGRYSIIKNGDRQLTKIRQRLLTIVQSTRETTQPALSPHGLQPPAMKRREKLVIPVCLTALCCGVLIAGAFIWCKYHLFVEQQRVTNAIYALQRIKMTVPQLKTRLSLAVLLRDEIEKDLLRVDENAQRSKVVINGDSMFRPGAVDIQPEMVPLIERIAREVHRVNGNLIIVGHTDSTPIRRAKVPDNKTLSTKRAENVAGYFIAAGLPAKNIKTEGVGDSRPITSNKTPQGRAKNRRLEFFVTY